MINTFFIVDLSLHIYPPRTFSFASFQALIYSLFSCLYISWDSITYEFMNGVTSLHFEFQDIRSSILPAMDHYHLSIDVGWLSTYGPL